MLAPIVLFAYNRPEHTRKVLDALYCNSLSQNSSLYIFIDGKKDNATAQESAKITEIKQIAAQKKWCGNVTIIAAPKNLGLFKSITQGVTTVVNKYGKAIVIEDDVLISPFFLKYMNDALDLYEHESKVMHISGYSRSEFETVSIPQSTYFFYHTTCWGWATWKRAWDKFIPNPMEVKNAVEKKGNIKILNMDNTFEMFWGLKAIADGKFQSWNTLWHSVVFLNNGLCLHPVHSLVSNIGHDGSGTNCIPDIDFGKNVLRENEIDVQLIPLINDNIIRRHYIRLHSFKYRAIFLIKHYLRYIFW